VLADALDFRRQRTHSRQNRMNIEPKFKSAVRGSSRNPLLITAKRSHELAEPATRPRDVRSASKGSYMCRAVNANARSSGAGKSLG
jgi:hypothetical protein